MITDILSYFLKFRHNVDEIHAKLMAEEKIALGKWFNSRKRYSKLKKRNMCHGDIVSDLGKTIGIDKLIVDHMDNATFKMYD